MKIKSGDLVMPGDYLGIVEQYLPGEGTYDDDGNIKSSILGNANLDLKNRIVSVSPLTGTPILLKPGDEVYGQIADLRSQRAIVDIISKVDENRELALPYSASIHISQVENEYLDSLSDAFRIGDIIKCKVSRITGDNVDLNTEDESDGVIKAMCIRCRSYLRPTNRRNELICEKCGKKQRRKMSSEYLY